MFFVVCFFPLRFCFLLVVVVVVGERQKRVRKTAKS